MALPFAAVRGARLIKTIQDLPSSRKPCPLNVARVLGVQLPKPCDLPTLKVASRTDEEVLIGLRSIRDLLASLGNDQNHKSEEAK